MRWGSSDGVPASRARAPSELSGQSMCLHDFSTPPACAILRRLISFASPRSRGCSHGTHFRPAWRVSKSCTRVVMAQRSSLASGSPPWPRTAGHRTVTACPNLAHGQACWRKCEAFPAWIRLQGGLWMPAHPGRPSRAWRSACQRQAPDQGLRRLSARRRRICRAGPTARPGTRS